MKTHILAGIIISGVLATSAASAAPTAISPLADEIYSGMNAAAIQKDQLANPAAERHSTAGGATCNWYEAKSKVVDQLHAAYPGSEDHFGEKDYLAAANQNFVC